MWTHCHEQMQAAARAYVPRSLGARGLRLVLLGDSITESWRGTSVCARRHRCKGVPEILASTLGALTDEPPLTLAISGDQTQHLLWRLRNGELSPTMKTDVAAVFVLLIGTNNLARGHSSSQTLAGILAVSRYILTETRGKLLINSLLPRGDHDKHWKDRQHATSNSIQYLYKHYDQSFVPSIIEMNEALRLMYDQSFMPSIVEVNEALRLMTQRAPSPGELWRSFPNRVSHIDCSEDFFPPSARLGSAPIVRPELMPDLLHPNAAGHRLWAACIERGLRNVSWVK